MSKTCKKIIELYSVLSIFKKIKFNLLKEKDCFLSEEFFNAELSAINAEIERIKKEINSYN